MFEGTEFRTFITRARFEELNADLFHSTMEHVERCLRDARIDKAQIDDIVLIGGSTRIPMVRKLLQDFFHGKELYKAINPDEAVAYGAVVQAAILAGDESEEFQDLRMLEVTPLSLGIEAVGGVMSVIIERNTALPATYTKPYTTYYNNQPGLSIQVFEGERPMTKDNNLLGKFDLTGIPPAPARVPLIEVTFHIDENGILNVTAVEKSTVKNNKISIIIDKCRLSEKEIEGMVKEAETYRAEDYKEKQRISAQNALESCCFNMMNAVEDKKLKNKLSESDKNTILDKCNEVLNWLDDNRLAEKEEFQYEQKELEYIFNSLMKNTY
jgi:L1 cell adhesion molecule like protein